jgi:hypothetical protein
MICSGVFVLAATGLLDGSVSAHWRRAGIDGGIRSRILWPDVPMSTKAAF